MVQNRVLQLVVSPSYKLGNFRKKLAYKAESGVHFINMDVPLKNLQSSVCKTLCSFAGRRIVKGFFISFIFCIS